MLLMSAAITITVCDKVPGDIWPHWCNPDLCGSQKSLKNMPFDWLKMKASKPWIFNTIPRIYFLINTMADFQISTCVNSKWQIFLLGTSLIK